MSGHGPGEGAHVIIAGAGLGDEGKGSVTDFLCSRYVPHPAHAVVRYNGGPQAGHNVVTADGRHHTFAQFGSGTYQGARTHLSRFMMVDPLTLAAEAAHLEETGVADPLSLLTVDLEALLITPWHVAAGRAAEIRRGAQRHGSCGMGIGACAAYAEVAGVMAPRFGDLLAPDVLYMKLAELDRAMAGALDGPMDEDLPARLFSPRIRTIAERTCVHGQADRAALLAAGPVIFEGAQGILLDEAHGFTPFVTWSNATFASAGTLLAEAGHQAVRVAVTRTYATRHGPGPFPSEDEGLAVLPEPHNGAGPWQGPFRAGHLDLVLLQYALDVAGGAAMLAVTHADTAARHPGLLKTCRAWDTGQEVIRDLATWRQEHCVAGGRPLTELAASARGLCAGTAPDPHMIADVLGVPLAITSAGPDAAAKKLTPAGGF